MIINFSLDTATDTPKSIMAWFNEAFGEMSTIVSDRPFNAEFGDTSVTAADEAQDVANFAAGETAEDPAKPLPRKRGRRSNAEIEADRARQAAEAEAAAKDAEFDAAKPTPAEKLNQHLASAAPSTLPPIPGGMPASLPPIPGGGTASAVALENGVGGAMNLGAPMPTATALPVDQGSASEAGDHMSLEDLKSAIRSINEAAGDKVFCGKMLMKYKWFMPEAVPAEKRFDLVNEMSEALSAKLSA